MTRNESLEDLQYQSLPVRDQIRKFTSAPTAVHDWPVLQAATMPGLVGEIVRLTTRDTEIDPAAVLISLLVRFGATLGPDVCVPIGEQRHPGRLFAVKVGATSRARKGTSEATIGRVFKCAESILTREPELAPLRVTGGPLSSGEGIVYEVRDPAEEDDDDDHDRNKKRGDPGVLDKRLLIIEQEFGGTLRVLQRDGNTLSAILRMAYDNGDIEPITKNNRIKATGAHICAIGHITQEELEHYLNKTEIWNGLANRFLWVCVQRQNLVPIPRPIPQQELDQIAKRLAEAIRFGRQHDTVDFSPSAEAVWMSEYAELTEDYPGVLGAITSRAEAHARRLMLIYTLLDCSPVTEESHVRAALAFCDYCRDSARFTFGDAETDPAGKKLLAALERGPMSRTAISELFSKHYSRRRLDRLIEPLVSSNTIKVITKKGKGPPTDVYELVASCDQEGAK